MIDYNAKDLIEQAQMLADLQNSDFISWKENIMFLDNAWTELYQQIINHGDKSFLKTLEFEGDRCELPCDFYQLHYICFSDGLNKRPINRKSKTYPTALAKAAIPFRNGDTGRGLGQPQVGQNRSPSQSSV